MEGVEIDLQWIIFWEKAAWQNHGLRSWNTVFFPGRRNHGLDILTPPCFLLWVPVGSPPKGQAILKQMQENSTEEIHSLSINRPVWSVGGESGGAYRDCLSYFWIHLLIASHYSKRIVTTCFKTFISAFLILLRFHYLFSWHRHSKLQAYSSAVGSLTLSCSYDFALTLYVFILFVKSPPATLSLPLSGKFFRLSSDFRSFEKLLLAPKTLLVVTIYYNFLFVFLFLLLGQWYCTAQVGFDYSEVNKPKKIFWRWQNHVFKSFWQKFSV